MKVTGGSGGGKGTETPYEVVGIVNENDYEILDEIVDEIIDGIVNEW